jgi:chromosome segregation ATPase
VIGSEAELDQEMTNTINHALNLNKSIAEGEADELGSPRHSLAAGYSDQARDVQTDLEDQRRKVRDLESIVRLRESDLSQKQAEITLCKNKISRLEDDNLNSSRESLTREREKNRILEDQYRSTFDTLQHEQNMIEMYRSKIGSLENEMSSYRERLNLDAKKGRALEGLVNELKDQLESTKLGYSNEISKLREMERSTQFELNLNKRVSFSLFASLIV